MSVPMKATVIDDGAFRLLAFPFGGPIPMRGAPRGADLDGQWFSERTDIKADWLPFRAVDWHHGGDETLARTVIGKATLDAEPEEDGHWVTVWLERGQRRIELIRKLAERGAQLFGSSESISGTGQIKALDGTVRPWARDIPGEIITWPYWRQTISTSPQNTHSVVRPLKAALSDLSSEYDLPGGDFWATIAKAAGDIGSDLLVTSGSGPGNPAATIPTDATLAAALAHLRGVTDRIERSLSHDIGD